MGVYGGLYDKIIPVVKVKVDIKIQSCCKIGISKIYYGNYPFLFMFKPV